MIKTAPVSYQVIVDPKTGRWTQGRVAIVLVTGWAVAGLLCTGYWSYRVAGWHPIPVTSPSADPGSVAADSALHGDQLAIVLLQIGWVLSLNALVPAAVLGCLHLRRKPRATARGGGYLAVLAVCCVRNHLEPATQRVGRAGAGRALLAEHGGVAAPAVHRLANSLASSARLLRWQRSQTT